MGQETRQELQRKAENALRAVKHEHARIGLAWVHWQRMEMSKEEFDQEATRRLGNLPKLEHTLETLENQLWEEEHVEEGPCSPGCEAGLGCTNPNCGDQTHERCSDCGMLVESCGC